MDELTMAIQSAVEAVTFWIQEIVKSKIQECIYDFGTPSEPYDRTGDFLNSFEMNIEVVSNYVIGKVFYNPDTLSHNPDNFQHGSNYSQRGDDIRPALAEILDKNLSGELFGANQWWHHRESFFDAAVAEIDANINTKFENEMTKRGIPWRRMGVNIRYGR